MRPEKKLPISTTNWRSTNQFIKRQISNLTLFRAALIFSLLAGLVLSFSLSPSLITTAQEQKPVVPYSEASSLIEAQAAGIDVQSVSDTSIETNSDAPEGGVCSWAASTVYPITILDQATVVQGNMLYSFAGVSTAIVATSYRFDGTTWTPIAPLPAALEYPQAVSDGTNIYIMGGVNATGASTALNRYNVAANTYTTLAPMSVGTWNHAAEFLNGKIYKFTGTAGSGATAASTNALEIYDIATNTWTAGAPYPVALSFVSSFVSGGFIYGAGGLSTVAGSTPSLKTYRYAPATNTWDDAAIADLPVGRWGAASSRVGYGNTNAWVLAGGVIGTAITNTAIEWAPATNAWTNLPNMIGERSRTTGGVLGGSFYVIGGRSLASPAFVGTNTNQRLTCLTNVAVINGGTLNIASESCGTPNGVPDPGETLTVTLPLTNTGDIPTVNLMATLVGGSGVTNPGPAQNFGAIAPGGAAVTRTFSFTVAGGIACGANITLTFNLTDGTTNYGTITRTFTTGARPTLLSENFDGVTAPALPAGWTNTQLSGTANNWVTTTTTPSSPPNAAFASDPATVNLVALTSPAVAITSSDTQITFRNQFNTENTFDGMVLEYSTNNGTTWTDVITGGGTFVSGGYTGTLSTNATFMGPLPGRMAWTGNSNGYRDTVVALPASLNGQSVRFRWLMGSDFSIGVAAGGVWIDDVRVLGARVCSTCTGPGACQIQRRNDFNGDGRTDFSVFRPSTGTWFIQPNGGAATGRAFGATGDRLQPADYDGDGRTDLGIYRNGVWYWVQSSDNALRSFTFGAASDIPVAGDYTGDGRADLAVYRPSTGVWYVRNNDTGALTAQQWGGAASDVPAVGDFDGDCKIDFAVRRTTNVTVAGATEWIILQSNGNVATTVRWGRDDMQMAIGDYNGDGRSDVGVAELRGGLLYWYVIGTTNNVIVNGIQFGQTGDIVTVGNYDGDASADLSVFRPSNSVFYYRAVTNATQFGFAFGATGDIPTARANQYPLP